MKKLYNLLLRILRHLPKSFSRRTWNRVNRKYGKKNRYIRSVVLKRLAKSVDMSVNIAPGVIMNDVDDLTIGYDVSINENAYISAYGGLKIGNSVSVGHSTTILSSDHIFRFDDSD